MNTCFSLAASIVTVAIAFSSVAKWIKTHSSKTSYWNVGQGRARKEDVGGSDGESCLNGFAAQMKDRVQFEKVANSMVPKVLSRLSTFLIVLLVCLIVDIVSARLFTALLKDPVFLPPIFVIWIVAFVLLIAVSCIFLKYEIVSMVGPWWLKRCEACKAVKKITLQNIRRIACYESAAICFIEAVAYDDMSRRSIDSFCDYVNPVPVNKMMADAVRNNKVLELNESEALPGSLRKNVQYVVVSFDGIASCRLTAVLSHFGYTAYDYGSYFETESMLRAEIYRLHMHANAGLLPCEFVEYLP